MSARQAAPPAYRTGPCQAGNHYLCRGVFRGPGAPVTCGCPCHEPEPPAPRVCGECGRPYEDDGAARLAELAALIPPCPSDDP